MKRYVFLSLDSKNGRAEFVSCLNVERNSAYVLILRPDATEAGRLQDPQTLESILEFLELHLGDMKKQPLETAETVSDTKPTQLLKEFLS